MTRYRVSALDEVAAPHSHALATLEWMLEAGQPYFDWFFGSREAASSIVREWSRRPSSEIALRRVRLVTAADGAVVGGFIAMAGRELRRARMADAAALAASPAVRGREGVLERLRDSRELFRAPGPDEFYLSKMAVLPAFRGRGHGRSIVEAYLDTGRRHGHNRFSLDVAAGNCRARALYENAGFALARESTVPGTAVDYVSMVLPAPEQAR